MRKNDLKTGMFVRRKDGVYAIVFRNCINTLEERDIFLNIKNWGWLGFYQYNEDLTFPNNDDFSIVEVWEPSTVGQLFREVIANKRPSGKILYNVNGKDTFEIGDCVKIVDIGGIYSTYTSFLIDNLDLLSRYSYMDSNPNTTEHYTVVLKNNHHIFKDRVVYAIENDNGQIYLMDENCLEKVVK